MRQIESKTRPEAEGMIVEILQNKNAATRFQIMVEIAASGPSIPQKSIAAKLGVTPQAISDYIQQLTDEKLIVSMGRSSYKVSTKGVNWKLQILRELRSYIASVQNVVTNITVCAAIAACDIESGQRVGLKMKDGLLMATDQTNGDARGIAVSAAKQGEDIDVANIEGLVELTRGKVTILQVPAIQKGGSKQTDTGKLKDYISDNKQLGTIGIEALISLRKINVEPRYLYGVVDAAIEAAQCGLPFTAVVTDDATPEFMKKLQEKGVDYTLIDLRRKSGK